ncbi:MAG: Calx-beta domain-containing protein [Patescibacteria group bacterium]
MSKDEKTRKLALKKDTTGQRSSGQVFLGSNHSNHFDQEDFERYTILTSVAHSKTELKKSRHFFADRKEYRRKLGYLRRQQFVHFLLIMKMCLAWIIRFFIPGRSVCRPSFRDHFRIFRTEPYFRFFRLALAVWLGFALVIAMAGIVVLLFYYTSQIVFTTGEQYRLADNVLGQLNQSSEGIYTFKKVNNANYPGTVGMEAPFGVVLDEINHRLFVSDMSNHRVLVFNLDSSNALLDRQADYVLGQSDFNAYGSSATQSGMNQPTGLAYDAGRNYLFVADFGNHRVLVFDAAAITNGENAVSVLGQINFTANSSATSAGGLKSPIAVAFNQTSSTLYVAEFSNHRVLFFDVAEITNGENAVNVLGQSDFTIGSSGITQSKFNTPAGLAISTSTALLFVSEYGNNRITVFDVAAITNGENAASVLGQGDFTTKTAATTQSGLRSPYGIALNSASNTLYVADSGNKRVIVFDAAAITNGENAASVLGQINFTNSAATASQSGLNTVSVLVSTSDNTKLYVADYANNRFVVYNVAAITNGEEAADLLGQLDGSYLPVYTTAYVNNVTPNAVGLNFPIDAEIDTVNHRLFVSDESNHRILIFNLDNSNNLIDRAADFVLGQSDFVSVAATTTSSGFNDPREMSYDAAGNRLFVVDRDNSRIMVFDVAEITNGENAIKVLGQSNFTGAAAATTRSGLNLPRGVYYDAASGYLFVGDTGNNRIIIYNFSDGITDGEDAMNVLGQSDYTSSGLALTSSGLNAPTGVLYEASRQLLFVADYGSSNNRVLAYNLADGTVNGEAAANVLGKSDFTSGSRETTRNGLNQPAGFAFGSNTSTLLVSDVSNNRIMVFDIAQITNGKNAAAVIGQNDFTSSAYGATQNNFESFHGGISFDNGNNRLYAADAANNRVMIFNFINLSSSAFATGTLGKTYSTPIVYTGERGTVSTSLYSGRLPNGLLISSGYVTGTPTATGTFAFTVQADEVQDTGTYSDWQSYSMVVTSTEVSFSTTGGSVSENSGTANITLSLAAALNVDVSFSLSYGGTAASGTDYSSHVSSAVIPSGATGVTLSIGIIDDNTVESDETVVISILSLANAVLGSVSTYTLSITSDDQAVVSSGGASVPTSVVPEFGMLINNGASTTDSNIVELSFSANTAVKDVALSNTADLSAASSQEFRSIKSWDLCRGIVKCEPGEYTVYARYRILSSGLDGFTSRKIYYIAKTKSDGDSGSDDTTNGDTDAPAKLLIDEIDEKDGSGVQDTLPEADGQLKPDIDSNNISEEDKNTAQLQKLQLISERLPAISFVDDQGTEKAANVLEGMARALRNLKILEGRSMEEIYYISPEQKDNVNYLKNKIIEFKAVAEVMKRMLLPGATDPLTHPYYTFGSIVLNVIAVNPDSESVMIPVSVALPSPAEPMDIMENNGFEFRFDENKAQWIGTTNLILAPGESAIRRIKMNDVWSFDDESINRLKKKEIELFGIHRYSSFAEQLRLINTDVIMKLNNIKLSRRLETVGPEEYIAGYADRRAEMNMAAKKIKLMMSVVSFLDDDAERAMVTDLLIDIIKWSAAVLILSGLLLFMGILVKIWKFNLLKAGEVYGSRSVHRARAR